MRVVLIGRRLALLMACALLGLAVGAVGALLSGNDAWYAAIPAVIALGWLFVADPTGCEHQATSRRPGSPTDE